jgi:hypothetical protein
LPGKDEAAEVAAQVQRYAGLSAPPEDCLAMDEASGAAFAAAGWSAHEHQLLEKWGVLAHLAPFIGMSLAALQAAQSARACGWLSLDQDGQSAIGVVVPHDPL